MQVTLDSPSKKQAVETGDRKGMLYRLSSSAKALCHYQRIQKNRKVRKKIILPLLQYIFLPLLHSADQK